MSKNHKKRCPHCGFLEVVKWGKRNGRTRYHCKNCDSYFTDRRRDITDRNKSVWFREWIVGKQTIERLAERSGYSVRHLKSYFHSQLPKCPTWHIQRHERVNLLIDGTYFANKVCLVVYRDAKIKMTLLYRLTDGERFRELKEDLRNIVNLGIEIESVTCDGAANILKAVREVCPEAILQRCTVHISREVETWITRKPQSDAARELLELVRMMNRIELQPEAQLWIRAFVDWYRRHEEFIEAKSVDETTGRWWYTHRMLHRSMSHIKRALPYMFNYTRFPNVPKTSNSIESFFGLLKDNLRIHRGLSEQHFKDFVKWYLFLQSNIGKPAKK